MVLGLRLHSLAFGLQPLTLGLPAICPRLPLAQNFHSDVAATFLRWKRLVSGAVSGVVSGVVSGAVSGFVSGSGVVFGAVSASFPAPFPVSFPVMHLDS